MYRNYIITTLRYLSRHKIYSFVNIAGLGLGLACAMLIILFVKDEVSYDRFHKKGGSIYRVVRRIYNPDGSTFASDGYSSMLPGPAFTANIPGIMSYVRIVNNYQDIKKGTDIHSQQILRVDSNFFITFSFPLIQGDPKTALSQPHTLVITEGMARREFGTTQVLGKNLLIRTPEGFQPYTITGIARACPPTSSIKFEAVTPINVRTANVASANAWLEVYVNTFIVLASNADIHAIETRMEQIYRSRARAEWVAAKKSFNIKWTDRYLLQPLNGIHLSKDYPPIDGLTDASNPVFSFILSGIAAFILLIACINFVNLTIARSLRRAKEIGIRKVIGSSRQQLIVRFLGESFFLCLVAFSLSIGLLRLALPLFNQLSGKTLSMDYLLDTKLIVEYILLLIATNLAAGFYPALILSGYDPVKTLYNRFSLNARNLVQRGLVTLQFALASFLIIATGIIASQFNFLVNLPLGYDDKDLVVINQSIGPDQFSSIATTLRQSPDILGVSGRNVGWYNTNADAGTAAAKVNTTIETIDAAYLPLLKIPVLAGRNFSPEYTADSAQSVLVNETFVREAGWKQPLSQTIRLDIGGNKLVRVIGVVKDHYFQPLNVPIKAQIFSLTLGRGIASFFIKIRAGSETSVLPFIEKVFRSRLPLNPYAYSFKDQENRANYASEERWQKILLFGAIMTIFISCIGLFGLSVFAAEKRTKEIGIRKVLGASVGGLVAGLSADFLRLVVLALAIAIPLAYMAADSWLSNYPYRIGLSVWLFAGAALLVAGIAALTVCSQAIRAAMANPVRSLRTE